MAGSPFGLRKVKSRECVVAIPSVSMAETVIRIGDISGRKVDKFKKFGLTTLSASTVKAPLIAGCSANLECSVIDYLENYNLVPSLILFLTMRQQSSLYMMQSQLHKHQSMCCSQQRYKRNY